jgi:hypothetical protein
MSESTIIYEPKIFHAVFIALQRISKLEIAFVAAIMTVRILRPTLNDIDVLQFLMATVLVFFMAGSKSTKLECRSVI